MLPADYVTSKQGTGLVHTAPAFGQDDYKLALKHDLKTSCIIDEKGFYSANSSDQNENYHILKDLDLIGKNVLDSNTIAHIEGLLSEKLVYKHDHVHSYPYDWRTKKPVIIRTSQQWFINTNKLKEKALEALKNVKIRPSNIANTMSSTLSTRPYWCISRQRVWGLPIPCLYETNDDQNKPIINDNLINKIKKLIQNDGNVDFWWSNKYDNELKNCVENLNDKKFHKSNDILDIWFDSGSSFNTVLKDFDKQADLYCEGYDQFSGWFQASLLLSVALNDKAPYKTILVHGFTVDEKNRKMSKSIGNVIEPMHAIKGNAKKKIPQCGNDVLRFWIVHEYHKTQIQFGQDILNKMSKRVFEIRSIIRFLVSNINDFDENSNKIEYENLLEPDKYMLHKLTSIVNQANELYNDYNLNKIILLIENFLLIDVSSFYIRLLKDRLYCEAQFSFQRQSAQYVLLKLLENCLIILAPILPHLCEEAFRNSILFTKFYPNCSSLFQTNLKFNVNSSQKWTNYKIDRLFQVLDPLKVQFNSIVQSNNAALYEICIKSDENLIKQLKINNTNNWLIDYFGCLNVSFQVIDSNASLQTNNEFDGVVLLEVNKSTDKYACVRCRRYINDKNECLCERCTKVVSEFDKNKKAL